MIGDIDFMVKEDIPRIEFVLNKIIQKSQV